MYAISVQALGVDGSLNADQILDQMDANKDGTIDMEEWEKFMTPQLKDAIQAKLGDSGLVAGFKPLVDIARVSHSSLHDHIYHLYYYIA